MTKRRFESRAGTATLYKKRASASASCTSSFLPSHMAPIHALPNVQLSYGPMLIGVFFNMILYGIFVGQILTYHQSQVYKKDTLCLRLLILYLVCVETANTALDMFLLYQPLVLEYGQKPLFFPTVFLTQPLSVVLVSMPIQMFFAWRICQLTASLWIPLIVSVCAVASFAGGVWTSVRIVVLKYIADKILLHDSELLWLLAACAADVIISAALVLALARIYSQLSCTPATTRLTISFCLQRGRKTGFRKTDSVIDKIIRTTIQTGMITALFSIFDVACFMAFPRDAINFTFDIALSKLYATCLLSSLNARHEHTVALGSYVVDSSIGRGITATGPARGKSEVLSEGSVFVCAPGAIVQTRTRGAGLESHGSSTECA
ncbi:hypothetical protein C8R47DRAFT_728142 [Mycena vitilis]|nr:hypothetical protein C8R47DRAFT_728142 [Mycena vitilis]